MKKTTICLFFLIIGIAAASPKKKLVSVTVENPGSFDRKNETVALSLKELSRRLSVFDAKQLGVFQGEDELLSQVTHEELLFQTDLAPHEKKQLTIKHRGARAAIRQSLVDGRFVLPREDYAWENDRIAFRVYGPALTREVNNGIDVWCKRVRYLIVEKWYKASEGGKDAYHEDHGEGADFFSVKQTLGAGSSGIWVHGRLYQPGVFSSYRTIDNGPIRVTFELTYTNWNVEGKQLTEVKRISLDAGHNLNRIESRFVGFTKEDTLQIAYGLAKRARTAVQHNEQNTWLCLWGWTNDDTTNGHLGTGIVVHNGSTMMFHEDKDHYFLTAPFVVGEPFVCFAGAGWTRSGDFSSDQDWYEHIALCAEKLKFPLIISLK
jgi:pectinesterase